MEADTDDEEFFRATFTRAVRSVSRIERDPDLAEDAAVEAIARAHLHWRSVGPDPNREAWVLRVADLLLAAPAAPAREDATDSRRRQLLFDPATTAWRRLPTVTISTTGQLTGAHHGPGPSRHWNQGQLWAFDLDTGTYRNTGVPSRPLGYVRWSVPWGTDKIVALVDARERAFDKYQPMKPRLAIVDLPKGP